MRVKTSVTLPRELIARLDRLGKNRSAWLEKAALAYLAKLECEERRDVEIINRNSVRLNCEAADVLGYQRLP